MLSRIFAAPILDFLYWNFSFRCVLDEQELNCYFMFGKPGDLVRRLLHCSSGFASREFLVELYFLSVNCIVNEDLTI